MKPNCAIFIKLLLLQCLAVVFHKILISSTLYNSGQGHTVTQNKVVAIQQLENPKLISAFMGFGLITTMAHTRPTAILTGNSPYVQSKISDLIRRMRVSWSTLACPSGSGSLFWSHEWEKHGTCSESILNQHGYFQAALNLKDKVDLLQILESAGIHPEGSYNLSRISDAIKGAIGYAPGIECNVDASGNSQLYQIYLCVDTSGSNLIKCFVQPKGGCASNIDFPTF